MRLTKRNADGIACSAKPFEISTFDMVDKLATYEDAEEQGRLVILPCKVGDKFYRAIKETHGRPDRINEYLCIGFSCVNFDKSGLQIRAYELSDGISHDLKLDTFVSASQFGRDIFLTWVEAKAALKGGQQWLRSLSTRK